jgi:hypothetical protein
LKQEKQQHKNKQNMLLMQPTKAKLMLVEIYKQIVLRQCGRHQKFYFFWGGRGGKQENNTNRSENVTKILVVVTVQCFDIHFFC